jgi:hypothetical protein
MVARHNNQITAGSVSFPQTTRDLETAPIIDYSGTSASDQRGASGRKLRNRLILVNAIAWVAIIAAVRLIFY